MFIINNIRIVASVALIAGALTTYLYIGSLQDDITSLRASEERYKLYAEQNATTANQNADRYKELQSNTQSLLLRLKTLEDAKNVVLDKQEQEEKRDDRYIDALDKESFESKCYNMVVDIR